MGIKYDKLIEQYTKNPEEASRNLAKAFRDKEIKPSDFDIGRLFEEAFGWENFKACRSRESLANDIMTRRLTETQGAVTTAAFQNISGQIVYNETLQAYEAEDLTFSALIPERRTNFLEGEKIAGVTQIGDEAAIRDEGMPYALAGVGEDWIFTPPLKDRGMIVPLTWEAVFADRTGQLLERAGQVGQWLAHNKEKRAIDCVIDENVTAHRYNWRGTVIASYGNNSGTHTWDNLGASNALLDWSDIDTAEQLFNELLDPFTGEPVVVTAKHLITAKSLEKVAMRILNATEIRVATPGYATSGNPNLTNVANPYAGKYDLVSTRMLASRLATDTDWFLGDIGAYARYMVAEPLNVVQAPSNSHDEFHRRIVAQYRANEIGAYVVIQPRAIVKCTA